MLNRLNRWTCFDGEDLAALGILNRTRVVVGAKWKPLPDNIVLKLDLVLKSESDPSSLTEEERRRLRRISNFERRNLLKLASVREDCEGDSSPTPTPMPTATVRPNPTNTPRPTASPVPTRGNSTPTPAPTSTPRNTATPSPTRTATPSPTHPPHEPPTGLPRLAASNNRSATAGITTSTVNSTEWTTRPGTTRDTFRTRVAWTHIAYNDPIVYPGQPGKSHLHMFFGNALVDASTNQDNIRSRCRSAAAGGTANCSGYWIPALLNSAGEVLAPDFSLFYYKAGYQVSTNNAVVPPQGLAMISGNMMGSPTNNVNDASYRWSCNGTESRGIPDCPAGSVLEVSLEFPTCWNGQDMGWSGDHKSHMEHGDGGRCPSSHPIQIPDITLNVEWRVPAGGTRGWKLSSDMYSVSDSARGGYSMHADWIMGWDPAIMQRFIDNCNNRQVDCVVDLLGDGFHLNGDHMVDMYR